MPSTSFLFRIAKIISVAAIGLMALLILIGNTTDYYTNYYFVEHVMKMDTTFPNSLIHYRSIHNTFVFHAGYILIILLELMMTFCCLRGSWFMFKNLKKDISAFHASKN